MPRTLGDVPDSTEITPSPGFPSDPFAYRGRGTPMQYDMEVIESVLWEVAVCAGNVSKAMRQLRHRYEDEGGDISVLPSPENVRRWIKGRFRNRYHMIVHEKLAELDRSLVTQQVERAIGYNHLEEELTRKIGERLGDLDAVEASTVLRNVSGAKKVAVDSMTAIRRGEQHAKDARNLSELAGALVNLGVATVRSHDADGSAVELPPGEGEGIPPSQDGGS